jgi:DNA-binding transcriptional ArsR family regulator
MPVGDPAWTSDFLIWLPQNRGAELCPRSAHSQSGFAAEEDLRAICTCRAIRLQIAHARRTVNHMVHYQARLDTTFTALSDVTRRGVLEQLGGADASITDLAQRFHMTLTGMKKHVSILEQAGLVTTEKVGRVRTCKLGVRQLEEEAAWIERHRQLWSARFDALDELVERLKHKEKADAQSKRK